MTNLEKEQALEIRRLERLLENKGTYFIVFEYDDLLEIHEFDDILSLRSYIDFMGIKDYTIIKGRVIDETKEN